MMRVSISRCTVPIGWGDQEKGGLLSWFNVAVHMRTWFLGLCSMMIIADMGIATDSQLSNKQPSQHREEVPDIQRHDRQHAV